MATLGIRGSDRGGAVEGAQLHMGVEAVSADSVARLSEALNEIREAAELNVNRSREIQRRVKWYVREIDKGASIQELVNREDSPRIVELLTMNAAALDEVGSGFRASLALALRSEGLTIEAIADLFGVTRQRISALLRQKAALDIVG